MKSKKAQEEMVGFVLIMLVVAVIFLVFIAIFIRKGFTDTDVESIEISHFLDSMLEYTTECSLDGGYTYLNVGDLFRECADNNLANCKNNAEETTCEILARTIEENLIENKKSWSIGSLSDGHQYGGYVFDALYDPDQGEPNPLFDKPISKSCAELFKRGSDKPVYTQGGKITISLTLCR